MSNQEVWHDEWPESGDELDVVGDEVRQAVVTTGQIPTSDIRFVITLEIEPADAAEIVAFYVGEGEGFETLDQETIMRALYRHGRQAFRKAPKHDVGRWAQALRAVADPVAIREDLDE